MSTKYTLNVTNNSTQYQDLCLYQKQPDLGVPNALPLAWLVAPAWPGTSVTFEWTLDYGFVWATTGSLAPGVTFKAQQTWPADPESLTSNQIQFDYRNNAFTFLQGSAVGSPQLGSLYIRELSGIPPNVAAVGIAMSNSGTFAVPAMPNMNLIFTPHPEYWLTAGTFSSGDVLNLDYTTNEVEVPFNSTFSMNAVLDAQNNWTVSAG